MMEMFRECEQLTLLDLSQFNTGNVTSMESMFNGCKQLMLLDVSKFSSTKLTTTKNMFAGCEALTKLTLHTLLNYAFTCYGVTDMESMFNGCKKLTQLDPTNLNTYDVSNFNYMFANCSSLKSLDLRKFKTNSMTSTDYMFANCTSLTQIKCNDTWKANSSYAMFQNCMKLKGAIAFDPQKLHVAYANPTTGYFYESVDYDLYINGVRVDSRNCDDLTQIEGVTLTKSTGKAVYYHNVRRLFLSDVEIKTNSGIGLQSGISNLEIICTGMVTIEGPTGMQLEGNTTIKKDDDHYTYFKVNATSAGMVIYDGTTTITGGIIFVTESQNFGISGRYEKSKLYGSLHISDGNTAIQAIGKSLSIGIMKEFKLYDNLQITTPTGAYIKSSAYNEVVDKNGNNVKNVIIKNPDAPVYNIKISGQQVNNSNRTDLTKISGVNVRNGGYAKYDPETNTLSLKNASIEYMTEYLVNCYSQGLIINLEDENYISQTSEEGGNALYIHAGTTITGGGKLICKGGRYNGAGILISDATLTIDNAIVEANGLNGVKGYIGNSRIVMKDGDGKLTAFGQELTITNLKEIVMENDADILQPEGASYKAYPTYSVVDSNNQKISAQTVVIATKDVDYGLEIAGIPITSKNYKNIAEMVASTNDEAMEAFINGDMDIQFDPANKLLTLKNATIKMYGSGEFGIYNMIDELKIKLIGNNTIESKEWTGLCSVSEGITIFGSPSSSSLMVKGVRGLDVGSTSSNYLRMEGCKISVSGSLYGIDGSVSYVMKGTRRGVSSYHTDIICVGSSSVFEVAGEESCFHYIKGILLDDGLAFTQPAGAIFKNNTVMVGDNVVGGTSKVVIRKGSGVKKGDVNLDGNVDISDIVAVINTIAGDTTYKATADVNADSNIDISDIVAIINIIAGM